MAVRYISVADARTYSGISSSLISDADMTTLIEDIEFQVERFLNTIYTPTTQIDIKDGNSKSIIFTDKAPLMALRALEVNDVTVDPENVNIQKSGQIELVGTSETPIFTGTKKSVFIKYVYGDLQYDGSTNTETSADASAGTSIDLTVLDETGFSTGDWVDISGFDGNWEAAKISGTSSNTITVEQVSQDHESGSIIKRLQIPPIVKRLMLVSVCVGATVRAVGQSFDDITGYTIGEFQVQKGEPYTQFREAINQFIRERDEIYKRLRPWPGIVI